MCAWRAKDVQASVHQGRRAQPVPACQGRPQPSTVMSVGTQIPGSYSDTDSIVLVVVAGSSDADIGAEV